MSFVSCRSSRFAKADDNVKTFRSKPKLSQVFSTQNQNIIKKPTIVRIICQVFA